MAKSVNVPQEHLDILINLAWIGASHIVDSLNEQLKDTPANTKEHTDLTLLINRYTNYNSDLTDYSLTAYELIGK